MKSLITELERIKELMLINEGLEDVLDLFRVVLKGAIKAGEGLTPTQMRALGQSLEEGFGPVNARAIRDFAFSNGFANNTDSFYVILQKLSRGVDDAATAKESIKLLLKNETIKKSVLTRLEGDADFLKKLADNVNFNTTDISQRYAKIDEMLSKLGLTDDMITSLKNKVKTTVTSTNYPSTIKVKLPFYEQTFDIPWSQGVYKLNTQKVSLQVDEFLLNYRNGTFKELSSYAKDILGNENQMKKIVAHLNDAIEKVGGDITKVDLEDVMQKQLKEVLGDKPYYKPFFDNWVGKTLLKTTEGKYSPGKIIITAIAGIVISIALGYYAEKQKNIHNCVQAKLKSISKEQKDSEDEQNKLIKQFEAECENSAENKALEDKARDTSSGFVSVLKGVFKGIFYDDEPYDFNTEDASTETGTGTYSLTVKDFQKWAETDADLKNKKIETPTLENHAVKGEVIKVVVDKGTNDETTIYYVLNDKSTGFVVK